MSARQMEKQVEQKRDELARTLDQLRDNLAPTHLAAEVLSGGHWLPRYWAFAKESRIARATMLLAAVAIGAQSAKHVR